MMSLRIVFTLTNSDAMPHDAFQLHCIRLGLSIMQSNNDPLNPCSSKPGFAPNRVDPDQLTSEEAT